MSLSLSQQWKQDAIPPPGGFSRMQKKQRVVLEKLGPSWALVLSSVWERSEVVLKAALQPKVNEVY